MKSHWVALILLLFSQNMVLFDFQTKSDINKWYILDDDVMGGRSNGRFFINDEGHGQFEGAISLENNGGFSSVRYDMETLNTEDYNTFEIRIKGDGKQYQFRAKSEDNQRFSYIGDFNTTGKWETIEIKFSDMYPSFRGYKLNQPNYPGERLSEIAFLIGNKKAEPFKMEIDYIKIGK